MVFFTALRSYRKHFQLGIIGALTLLMAPEFVPAHGHTLSTVFAVIGDYGTNGPSELAVSNLVKGWSPEFIITVGDNNYPNGEAASIDQNVGQYYHDFIYPYLGSYGVGAPVNRFYPALGNHDWYSADGAAQPYLDYFSLPNNERYYDFVQGPVHFLILDSDDHEPDGIEITSTQAAWLKTQLTTSTAPWQLVFMHHPPYSSGVTHGSYTELQWPYQDWGADAVLAGHEHQYERVDVAGFPYFVTGVSGDVTGAFGSPIPESQVRYNAEHGAMRVEASASQIVFQFINKDGVVIDTYTLTVPGTLTHTPTSTSTVTPTDTSTLTAPTSHTPTTTLTHTPTNTPTLTTAASHTPTATTPTPNTTPNPTVTWMYYLPILLRFEGP